MKLLAALSVFAIFCSLSQLCHSREKNPGAQQDGPVPNEYITKFVRENQLLFLSNYLIDYAHLHGALFIDTKNPHQKDGNNLSNHFSVTMPMTVFPSPYPDALFKQAQGLQKLMAELHLRVSRDYKFISDAMKLTAEADTHFIGKLVKIMDAVHNNRRQSGMTLILQRSDYLTHLEDHPDGDHKTIQLKQIESTGGNNAGQGDFDLLSKMHQRMVDKVRYMADEEKIPAWVHDSKLKVPKNEVIQGQAEAIFQTWLRFSEMHGDPRAVILLISAPKRRAHSHYEKLNMTQFRVEDIAMAYEKQQREAEKKKMGENTQQKYYRPHLVQITIKECAERLYLKKDDHHLILKDEMGEDRRVAIAYFMDGYLPKHFQSEAEWKIRLEMEQSEAVIQPNIFVYFAGSKTVQQALTEPDALDRFFPEAEPGTELADKLAQLRGTFIQQWALGKDDEEEKALVKLVMAKPHDYVLKSNRQGGKGTFFDQEIVAELGKQGMTAKQRGEFVVQKKIKPFYVKNLIMPEPPQPETQLDVVDVNSELSIFGALLAITKPKEEKHPRDRTAKASSAFHADQHIVLNTVDGYGVRTKVLSNKMCTISGGLGGLDSLVPMEMEHFLAKSQSTESGEGKEVESCAAAGGQFAIDGEEKGPAVPA